MSETENNQTQGTSVVDSKYRKVLVAAKRSKQLQRGARPRVHMPNAKNTRIALVELEQGLIQYEASNDDES